MSDNRRRFCAVRDALKKYFPGEPKGNAARRLNVLAALVIGIVGSRSSNLPHIAQKVPDKVKRESRVKRFSRFVANELVEVNTLFLPFSRQLLQSLAHQTLVLIIDGSEVGRGCVTLMVSVVYKKRALPIAFIVVNGHKGHFPQSTHVDLFETVYDIIPQGSDVVVLGDGEFDGTTLQQTLDDFGWSYICRTAKNAQLCADGQWFSFSDVAVQPGNCLGFYDVMFTQDEYGPVLAIAWFKPEYKEPIYLVTNLPVVEEACYWYRKRFYIETMFSDQKSRGFNLHKSHIEDADRLTRLMMAVCLAYIWIIYLGAIAKKNGWLGIIHRTDRCDLSLFQLGLVLLDYLLDEKMTIDVAFHIPCSECVR